MHVTCSRFCDKMYASLFWGKGKIKGGSDAYHPQMVRKTTDEGMMKT